MRNETAHTFEASAEHDWGKGIHTLVNGFYYGLHNVIEAIYESDAVQQYMNHGAIRSSGVELEVSATPWGRVQATGSLVLQRARQQEGTLPNSPRRIGQFRFAVPVAGGKLLLSSASQYQSARYTMDGDPVRPVLLTDATTTLPRIHPEFDLQVGVRNLLNWSYQDPVYLAVDRMTGMGRSVFVKLIWHSRE